MAPFYRLPGTSWTGRSIRIRPVLHWVLPLKTMHEPGWSPEVGEKETMRRFEYQITRHPADTFKEVIYFCSEEGECNLETIPSDQIRTMESILNVRGRDGWEIVQVSFGKDGLLAFWKRMVVEGAHHGGADHIVVK